MAGDELLCRGPQRALAVGVGADRVLAGEGGLERHRRHGDQKAEDGMPEPAQQVVDRLKAIHHLAGGQHVQFEAARMALHDGSRGNAVDVDTGDGIEPGFDQA